MVRRVLLIAVVSVVVASDVTRTRNGPNHDHDIDSFSTNGLPVNFDVRAVWI